MSLLSRLQAAFSALKGSRATKRPDWPEQLIGEMFALPSVDLEFPKARRLVSTVAKCSSLLANDVAQLPMIFEQGEGEDWKAIARKPGNIVDIWESANYADTAFELKRDLQEALNTQGNAYLFLDGPNPKKPLNLWSLHAHLVTPKVSRGRIVDHYSYDRGGVIERIEPSRIIHLRKYNSEDQPVGLSPLEAVRLQYESKYDISRLIQKMLRAGGIANGYFKVPAQNGVPVTLTEPERKAMEKQLLRHHGGIDNAFKPIVLDVLEWVQSGLTLEQIKAVELSAVSEYEIAGIWHIPPERIGLPGKAASGGLNGTGTNSSERDYWQSGVMPETTLRDTVLTERFCKLFGSNIRVRTDFSQVIALQQPLLDQATAMTTLAGRPCYTVNEVRKLMGQPAIDDPSADVLYEAPVPSFGGPNADPNADPATDTGKGDAAPDANEKKPDAAAKSRMIDGDEQREMLRKRASADIKRYERQMEREFVAFFDTQEARVQAALELSARSKRTVSADDLLDFDEADEAAIQRILAELVRQRGEAALAEIGLTLELQIHNARAAAFITANAQRVLTNTTETTRRMLREALAQGVSQGQGISELAAIVRDVFDNRRSNAITIARTEIVSAYNFATTDAWAQSGEVESHEWLSSRDTIVRPTHVEADGQTVELGSTFTVGEAALSFPGDPTGIPQEVINCRCTTLPILKQRSRKLPSAADWFRQNPNGTALRRNRIKDYIS